MAMAQHITQYTVQCTGNVTQYTDRPHQQDKRNEREAELTKRSAPSMMKASWSSSMRTMSMDTRHSGLITNRISSCTQPPSSAPPPGNCEVWTCKKDVEKDDEHSTLLAKSACSSQSVSSIAASTLEVSSENHCRSRCIVCGVSGQRGGLTDSGRNLNGTALLGAVYGKVFGQREALQHHIVRRPRVGRCPDHVVDHGLQRGLKPQG
jgi:hypothetical protein